MNRITYHDDFLAEWNELKKQAPLACTIIKESLLLLRNSEPRSMPGVEWDDQEDYFTWVFEPPDLGVNLNVEVDFRLYQGEVMLLALQIV